MIASPVIGIWYWCTDQYIVQRTLSARSLTDARRGAIWGGFLKVWSVFIFLVPGMIGYALHQKGVFTIPTGPDGETMLGDMVFPTTVVVGFGLLWIPIMKRISEGNAGLYDYLQNVQGFLAPPITAVFLLGLFNKRINARGAFGGLVIGFILGMVKLTLQTLVQSGALAPTGVLGAIGAFNGYYFSGVLFLISVVLVIVLSMTDAPQPASQIQGLTYAAVTPEQKAETRASWGAPEVIGTVVVLGLVLWIYLYFSFWLRGVG